MWYQWYTCTTLLPYRCKAFFLAKCRCWSIHSDCLRFRMGTKWYKRVQNGKMAKWSTFLVPLSNFCTRYSSTMLVPGTMGRTRVRTTIGTIWYVYTCTKLVRTRVPWYQWYVQYHGTRVVPWYVLQNHWYTCTRYTCTTMVVHVYSTYVRTRVRTYTCTYLKCYVTTF